MKLSKVAGATSEIWQVFVRDSSSTTGGGLTGLVFNTASLTAYYHRDTDTTATAISLVTMTVGTFTSSGFKEIDATNMPGWYQFCPPNAAIASGAKSCGFHLKGATNMAPLPIEVQLTAVNADSATAFITGVNSLAPPTNWNSMAIDGSGRVDVSKIGGTSQTARDIGASVLLSTGTGTGQLDFTSGVVKANATQFAGQTITAAAGVTIPSSIASPTNITAAVGITVATNSDKTGYALTAAYDPAKTASQAGDAMALTSGERNSTADAFLNRDMSTGTDSGSPTVRTVRQALRFLRNKFAIVAGTMTVYKEDDTTASWTSTLVTTAGDPISSSDPA